ncbi:hypothetical protein E3U43_020891 [Larimichthys crocea]|uniref:Uncharacterized protein n=1 Tax=Larimichthys crocea TaxID=215358 RepID=A0ACD3Q888_LARCR|nr:hypothetical protein E3U43_020891 [Larimichthys crocea]
MQVQRERRHTDGGSALTVVEEEGQLVLDRNPLEWSVDEVVQFINSTDCASLANIFQEQDIDGQALLLLTLPTVQECMDLKLGPAIKLCHQIERVKGCLLQTVRQLTSEQRRRQRRTPGQWKETWSHTVRKCWIRSLLLENFWKFCGFLTRKNEKGFFLFCFVFCFVFFRSFGKDTNLKLQQEKLRIHFLGY